VKRPIRARLTIVYALSTAAVLAGLSVFVYALVEHDLTESTDLGLRSRAQSIVDEVSGGDLAVTTGSGTLIDNDEAVSQIIDDTGRILAASTPASQLPPLRSPAEAGRLTGPAFFDRVVPEVDSEPLRILAVPAGGARGWTVVVGATLGDRQDALDGLALALGVGSPIAVAFTAAAAWIVAGRGLRPVERLRQEAAAISASDLGHRLAVPSTNDEVARLADTLNGLLGRLAAALDAERRLVDDASHELRTPLSILKMELDLALARPRTVDELRSALRSAADETDRLVALAEDLLVLARLDGGHLRIHREPTSLAALFDTIAAAYQPRAQAGGVRLRVSGDAVVASVDPVRVRQAVENLLDNALRATPARGEISLRASRTGPAVAIVAEDTGPGFPESFLTEAFEPFARADAGEPDGGAGLGLAIVRAIAVAHHGSVVAQNRAGGGARVTLTLPDQRPPVG
jgi:heavy metal sensor kinase